MPRRLPLPARRAAVAVYRALPPRLRRLVVRVVTPNYTVGSVVLLRDHGGRLLLLRQPVGPGWSLPGGLLDRREHPVAGAARELAEETGVRLSSDALAAASPNALVCAPAQQVDVVFTATVDSRGLELTLDEAEVLEAAWHDVDRLPPLTPATARLLGTYGMGPAPETGPRRAGPPRRRQEPPGRPSRRRPVP